MLSQKQVSSILSSLTWNGMTAGEFIVALLQNHTFYPEAIENICIHAPRVLDMFTDIPGAREAVTGNAMLIMQDVCTHKIMQLTKKDTGFQFRACHIQESQLVEADIDEMATKMEGVAPTIWNMLNNFLSANAYINCQREFQRQGAGKQTSKVSAGNEDIEMDAPSNDEEDERDATMQDTCSWDSIDTVFYSLILPVIYCSMR